MSDSSSRRFPRSSPAAEPAELQNQRLLALVVEDDPELRRMVRQNLERLRVRASKGQDVTLTVLEAANARSALSLMSTVAPDLVVLDLLLPELSGYEVCERLRANAAFERVPVLAISARAMPQERAAAEEAGASAFLAKPFTKQQLAEQVLPLLEDNDREK